MEYDKRLVDLYNRMGTVVGINDEHKYMYLPFWFEVNGEDDIIVHRLSELPPDLKSYVDSCEILKEEK